MESKRDPKTLLALFLTTAKIGGVTFGGGYAMVPVMQDEFVRKKKFFSDEEFSAIITLAQSLPGPIAVNTSAMAGYRLFGLTGAVVSVCGSIMFPFAIILAIAMVLKAHYQFLAPFVRGMKVPLFAILVLTVLRMWRKNVRNLEELLLFSGSLVFVSVFKVNPVIVISLAVLYSGLSYSFRYKVRRDRNGRNTGVEKRRKA
ncbi:chromate transporter [Fervidobacterium thailandense]|uniref:chromate transporter n=1 Tax=Fervidobacterium thailandense TaxID=1008305 RepID=UPI0008461CAB|nr:chromate transporter [Fervidobacterium thailandense]